MVSAVAAIRHRGPDGQGSFESEARDCHLGHVRLSIIDLSQAASQPMMDISKRYVISCNGEIYNFQELRKGLEERYGPINWASSSDTQVIVEGFAREGSSFLSLLNGMFALAIYDKVERLLHVLRDPIGIKPLFVTEQMQSVFFCSELRGLRPLPGLKWTPRRESLGEQLAFMYVPEPNTMYREFRKVTPGICFTYQNGRLLRLEPLFSHLEQPIELGDELEIVKQLADEFSAAVKRQLVSDVPVSLFLSGGLDSSAIAMHAHLAGEKIKSAYTISFAGEDRYREHFSDDLRFARIMAQQIGFKLEVIEANPSQLDLIETLIPFLEDGVTDPALLNTYLISDAARQSGVKVMLSGHGADEYLGGYRRHQLEGLFRRMPHSVVNAVGVASTIASRIVPQNYDGLRRRLTRVGNATGGTSALRIRSLCSWTSIDVIDDLLIGDEQSMAFRDFDAFLANQPGEDLLSSMLKVDQNFDLLALNLCYMDRLSMAASVEVRVPFLDLRLVQLMNSIPIELKVKGINGKYIFKKAMEPYLPKEIIHREKAGFGLPIRAWLGKDVKLIQKYLNKDRIRKQGLFNPEAVQQVIKEQTNGIDRAYTLFTLLIQQIWLDHYAL